jgi:phytanoyl-CoA hydroxylase
MPEHLTPEQVAQYDRDGCLVVRGLLVPEEIAEIRDTFMEQSNEGPVPGLSEIKRGKNGPEYDPSDPLHFYPRMMQPHRHPEFPVGPLARRYLLDARIGAVLGDLLREEPVAAQTMFYFKPPGARGQALHQDNFYLRVQPGTCIAAWIAVDDADRENGGMVVVPGSGDLEIACPEPADKTRFFTDHHVPVPSHLREQPVDLKAGDVLFFNGSVIHGSYPNTSQDRFRRALISHYVPESCAEVSHWYRPLLRFDGTELIVEDATGGGPCGMEGAAVKGPH